MGPKVTKPLVVLLIIALEIGAGLIILELYLRYTSTYAKAQSGETGPQTIIRETDRGKRLVPNAKATINNTVYSGHSIQMNVNAYGFRDIDFPLEKMENEIRILVLGDSITWGNALEANEVYVERTEQYLGEKNDGKIYQVINAGVGDTGILEQMDILKEQGLQVNPDVVVLGFYLNDSRPPWGFTNEIRRRGWLRRHSVLAETIYRELVARSWIKEKGLERFNWYYRQFELDWKHDQDKFQELITSADLDWGAAWKENEWKVITPYLNQLEQLSKDYNFRVVVMIFPVSFQVFADFVEDAPQKRMEQEAIKRNFFFFDPLPILRQHANGDLYFDHAHPKEIGNDIIGRALADYLWSNVLQ